MRLALVQQRQECYFIETLIALAVNLCICRFSSLFASFNAQYIDTCTGNLRSGLIRAWFPI